jgi:hypothetical protein
MTTETTTTITVEQLEAVGGKKWEKAGMSRVYFNDLDEWYGLETSRYNTGNISSARLDGEHISNNQAKKIMYRLSQAKVYFDLADGKFHGRDISQSDFDVIKTQILKVAAIVAARGAEQATA